VNQIVILWQLPMINGYIITLDGNVYSEQCANRCVESISRTESKIKHDIFCATTPRTYKAHCKQLFGEVLPYTWPRRNGVEADPIAGIQKHGYSTDAIENIMATTLSHARLWKECVTTNKPALIMEHDAVFTRKFDMQELLSAGFKRGAVAINSPLGATRKAVLYHQIVSSTHGLTAVPDLDRDLILPPAQGLPGNSAYVIAPKFAQQLLEELPKRGIWPNDAFMCRQLFPNLLYCYYPYFTTVNQSRSTSQGK
jgi:GR25 family glycosyltransferase involved in LPS biosynthesis